MVGRWLVDLPQWSRHYSQDYFFHPLTRADKVRTQILAQCERLEEQMKRMAR